MTISLKGMALSLIVAGAFSCASMVVYAGSRVPLTDNQLDFVTAGNIISGQGGGLPFATSAADATGLGLRAFGGTQTMAVIGIGSPGNDGPFGGSNAQASAYAYGGGLNGVSPGSGTANAAAVTQTPGNLVVNIGWNYTVYGIGTTVQGSVSSSTGLFVPGMP